MENITQNLNLMNFQCCIDEDLTNSSAEHFVIRAALNNLEQCKSFVKVYGELTDSMWNPQLYRTTAPVR